MLTISRPPGRSTRRISASAGAGSTADGTARRRLTAASKLASAKGRALIAAGDHRHAGLRRAPAGRRSGSIPAPSAGRSGRCRAAAAPGGRRCRSRHRATRPALGRTRSSASRTGHAGRGTTTCRPRPHPSDRILQFPRRGSRTLAPARTRRGRATTARIEGATHTLAGGNGGPGACPVCRNVAAFRLQSVRGRSKDAAPA